MTDGTGTGITPRVRAITLRMAAETLELAFDPESRCEFDMEFLAIRNAAAELERLSAERDAAWAAVAALQRSLPASMRLADTLPTGGRLE
jgi:hypothetical protein